MKLPSDPWSKFKDLYKRLSDDWAALSQADIDERVLELSNARREAIAAEQACKGAQPCT